MEHLIGRVGGLSGGNSIVIEKDLDPDVNLLLETQFKRFIENGDDNFDERLVLMNFAVCGSYNFYAKKK